MVRFFAQPSEDGSTTADGRSAQQHTPTTSAATTASGSTQANQVAPTPRPIQPTVVTAAQTQADAPQAQATTTQPQATTTEPQATTTEPQATTTEPQASAPQAQTAAAQPATQTAQEPTQATQPASSPAPEATTQSPQTAQAPAPRYGVGLDRAIETVHMTLSMAARQGASQARIQLSPASLGGIRIHLQQTSNGLVARVVTDHAGAAQTIQQGGAELRRSLESAGVPLLRLDVQTADQQRARADNPDSTGTNSRGTQQHSDANASEEQSSEQTARPVQLPNGAVVDVLA